MYSIIKKQGICSTIYNSPSIWLAKKYRPYPGGVASRLVTDIYVAMVMPVLYDNSYSQMTQISNELFKKNHQTLALSIEFYHKWQSPF